MQPGTLTTVARTSAVVLVIIVAAVLGLFVGDALRDGGSALDAGAATTPVSRTADASFSLDAISAIAAIRDTSASTAAAAEDYPDYPLRHPAAPQSLPTSPSGATLE